jgi:hypothetical protein
VRNFLGLTGYYKWFIHGYGDIDAPLTHHLKREAFCWSVASVAAFEALKIALTTAHVLQLPNFS